MLKTSAFQIFLLFLDILFLILNSGINLVISFSLLVNLHAFRFLHMYMAFIFDDHGPLIFLNFQIQSHLLVPTHRFSHMNPNYKIKKKSLVVWFHKFNAGASNNSTWPPQIRPRLTLVFLLVYDRSWQVDGTCILASTVTH